MLDINKLVNSYLHYIQSEFQIDKIDNNTYEISTPFLDRSNDNICFYVILDKDRAILTDGGETLQNLRLSGIDLNSEKRKKELDIILNGFGIFRDKASLQIEATAGDFARKQHNIIQAILSVNDMFVASSDRVVSFFFDDVIKYFDKIDVRYITNVSIEGKSHFSHKFDFIISKSKNQKERLVKLLNSPKKDNLKATLFSYMDLATDRAQNDKIIIFNDNNTNVKDLVLATTEYNIKPIKWSEKEQYLNYFAA
ncbi:DUF1829 domain-containing protein [Campylobacter mucosalis]|uniref:Putative DUF1828, DUF1829 domains n=1 Tax=Campylobacter mucosalis CCUG 21559 TaxID=1032067 RepID=A0A6G5QF20_9BACT|nr:DUF1829 domain-containing protein [Campylobacter mucosalis]QCD44096.1 putative DUF1828, DUF1829 domains) [Campylobacter mucosalis CCUG 21559]QCD44688.1 putative DUF1828, DUF1829 domains) [Campylobacter mucosalis CCUG 21559]